MAIKGTLQVKPLAGGKKGATLTISVEPEDYEAAKGELKRLNLETVEVSAPRPEGATVESSTIHILRDISDRLEPLVGVSGEIREMLGVLSGRSIPYATSTTPITPEDIAEAREFIEGRVSEGTAASFDGKDHPGADAEAGIPSQASQEPQEAPEAVEGGE